MFANYKVKYYCTSIINYSLFTKFDIITIINVYCAFLILGVNK
ncbi:hypothetical protein H04402_03168 [Clostridium botulinum H04402 065]|nr:hypothetical protein H04402_03168 [Clostridium botulinum H04402 065]